jgi:hypothetical protein
LRTRIARRETLLVAGVLLVPLPLFALSGLNVPLPGVLERGLGSLVTLDAEADPTDTKASLRPADGGQGAERREQGSLGVPRGRRALTRPGLAQTLESDGTSENSAGAATDRGGESPPAGETPEGAGGGGGSGPSGGSEPAGESQGGAAAVGSAAQPAAAPKITVGAGAQGTSGGVSVGPSGIAVDDVADNGSGTSGDTSSAGIAVTGEDGRQTGVGTEIPAGGVAIP